MSWICSRAFGASSPPLPLQQADRLRPGLWIIQPALRGRGDGEERLRGRWGVSGASSRAAPLRGDFSRDSPCWDRYHLYYHWHVMWRRRRGWRLTDESAFRREENFARSCGIMERITGSNNSPVSSIVWRTHTNILSASISAGVCWLETFILKNIRFGCSTIRPEMLWFPGAKNLVLAAQTHWKCHNFTVLNTWFCPHKTSWRCCNFPDLKTRFDHHKTQHIAAHSHSKTPCFITTKHSGEAASSS